jgi:hypothetical protein
MSAASTRRSALGFTATAIVAGLTTPALASAPAVNADAELIRFSSRVAAVCAKMDALYAVRHTIEDEHRTQPQMDALRAERVQATDHIYDLPDPTTLAGARAMAIASIALAPRDRDGSISYSGESERLAWVVAEFLAGSAAA